jgi:rod shape determining protein RodA
LGGGLLILSRKNRSLIFIVVAAFVLSSGYALTTDYVFNRVLEPHQQQRINVLLGKEVTVKDADYNVPPV